MANPQKQAMVAELAEQFRESHGAVLTDYRGLSVPQLQELRRSLGQSATYAITKNTLTKLAADEAGIELDDSMLVGPTAIAFITGDVADAAKGLRNFAKTHPDLEVKGGFLDGANVPARDIERLADLESREVLLGKLAGGMKASLQSAASLFNAPLAQAARAAAALRDKDPSALETADADSAAEAGGTAEADSQPDADSDTTAGSADADDE